MPSLTVTPAQLEWSGVDVVIEPVRMDISPASLQWQGGFVLLGLGTGTTLSVTTPQLDRMQRLTSYFDREGRPTAQMQLLWQRHCEAIEGAFEALTAQVNDNTALLAEIRAAQLLATVANDNSTATSQAQSLKDSYTANPANPLTASNDGTITIAAHDRVYAGSEDTPISVGAGSVSGLSQGSTYNVFYLDSAREGGGVTYQVTQNNIAQTGNVHVVGQISIPGEGEVPVSGTPVTPPGGIDPSLSDFYEYVTS